MAVYFESSIEPQDLNLLPAAATAARVAQPAPDELVVDTPQSARIAWSGAVELDGRLWPVQSRTAVLIPAGKHRLTPGSAPSPVHLADFNGDLKSAITGKDSVELSYSSRSRAIAILGSNVAAVDVDGASYWKPDAQDHSMSVLLPAGEHILTLHR